MLIWWGKTRCCQRVEPTPAWGCCYRSSSALCDISKGRLPALSVYTHGSTSWLEKQTLKQSGAATVLLLTDSSWLSCKMICGPVIEGLVIHMHRGFGSELQPWRSPSGLQDEISRGRGGQAFSSSSREVASYTWKEINHRTRRRPVLLYTAINNSIRTPVLWLWCSGAAAVTRSAVCRVLTSGCRLTGSPVSLIWCSEVRAASQLLIPFLFKQAACCTCESPTESLGLMWLTWGGQACFGVPVCRMSLSSVFLFPPSPRQCCLKKTVDWEQSFGA